MALKDDFYLEVARASNILNLEPVRELPDEVKLSDFPVIPGYRAGARLVDRTLEFSSELDWRRLRSAMKREALILFLPDDLDENSLVYDLAWAYSDPPIEWWMECMEAVKLESKLLPAYNPITLLQSGRKSTLNVIRGVVKALRAAFQMGQPTCPELYYVIMRSQIRGLAELSEGERKILNVFQRKPSMKLEGICRETGMSKSVASRIINRLRNKGVLFGPHQVFPRDLNLYHFLISFPNDSRRMHFYRFPFTFRMFIPVSREADALAFLILPSEARASLSRLPPGLEGYFISHFGYSFQFDEPEPARALEAMSEAILSGDEGFQFRPIGPRMLRLRLDREDMRILAIVSRTGKATVQALEEEGVKSAKVRLQRLRKAGLITCSHKIEGVNPQNALLIRLKVDENEMSRAASVIARVTSLVAFHAVRLRDGSTELIAVAFPSDGLRSVLPRNLRILFGDDLIMAEGLYTFLQRWEIPYERWDEEMQSFIWKEDFERLVKELMGVSRTNHSRVTRE